MADHYIGFNRGKEGFKISDFTVGAASGATDMELRIADAANLTRKDIVKFLDAIERYYNVSVNNGGPTFPKI